MTAATPAPAIVQPTIKAASFNKLGEISSVSIQEITTQIKTLLASVQTRTRKLKEDRLQLGHLFIALRDKFGVQNKTGKKFASGKTGGSFCAHVLAHGWNLTMVYNYIALASGKNPNSPVRVNYWQTFNKQMKKASDKQKLALLKKAVEHIVKLYEVKATFAVTEVKP